MPAAVYPALQSAVLLCIDDNEDVLECEKSFLESFGYSVLMAASGGKGLELASKHSVDVVILDYFMPEMNGDEVAIEMRRLRPQAPIIMLSGAVDIQHLSLRVTLNGGATVYEDHAVCRPEPERLSAINV